MIKYQEFLQDIAKVSGQVRQKSPAQQMLKAFEELGEISQCLLSVHNASGKKTLDRSDLVEELADLAIILADAMLSAKVGSLFSHANAIAMVVAKCKPILVLRDVEQALGFVALVSSYIQKRDFEQALAETLLVLKSLFCDVENRIFSQKTDKWLKTCRLPLNAEMHLG